MSENSVKEKKPIYKKWWFWLIIVVVVLVIASSGSSNNTNTTTSSDSSIFSSEDNSNKVYAVGEEATLGNGSVTVTKVEKSNGSTYDRPKSGKEYVIVYVTIKNNGTSNLSYNPYHFEIQNSQGQQEDQAFSTIDQDTSLSSGELIPGGSVSGSIVFEQPINDANLVLVYQNSIWSSKSIQIKL